MLCFPAVLFSGAIIPVHVMAGAGAAISTLMPDRWAFEALGHDLGIRHLLSEGGSPLGPPLLRAYGSAGTATTGVYWLYLAAFAVVFFAGAWVTLVRKCRRSTRSSELETGRTGSLRGERGKATPVAAAACGLRPVML